MPFDVNIPHYRRCRARRRYARRWSVRRERPRGWQQNRAHTAWTYRDTTASPLNGITRLRIEDESRTQARRVTVKVTGRNGVYPVVSGDEPLEATLVLGDQTEAAAGVCGESAFVAPDCAFNRRATTLNCR